MAVSNEATIRVRIDGRDAEVSVKDLGKAISTTMRKANEEGKKLKSSFDKIGGMAEKFYFSMQSLKMLTSQVRSFIDASNAQETAVAGVAQVMRSMGRYTDEAFKSVQKLASQIQSEGIIGDEEILRGTKFLMTYKDITQDIMPEAMRVMADFAALTGGDVASAANILGKASMGLTGELTRYGITLSEEAKKSKDFNLILKEIKEQVGGQNKALAETSAGGLKQFANAWGDLKEVIGDFIKTVIIPLTQLIRPLVEFLTSLNADTQAMIGTVILATATLWKLIPALRAIGITSKFALGPIGLIIAALELLYVAYQTNFLGIGDAVDTAWEYLKAFWEFLKNWAKNIGDTFRGLGKIMEGALTFNIGKIKEGWTQLTDSITSSWNAAFDDIQSKITTEAPKIVANFKKVGTEAGKAIQEGIEAGRQLALGVTGGVRGGGGKKAGLIGGVDVVEQVDLWKEAFGEFKSSLSSMGVTAVNVFAVIENGIYNLSSRLVDSMFNARVKFKDIWQGIAKDFLQLFVNEILKYVATVLIPKLLVSLAIFDKHKNDMMAVQIGRDYARFFTQGVLEGLDPARLAGAMAMPGGGFSDSNIVRQLALANRRLAGIEQKVASTGSATVSVGDRQIYGAVNRSRTFEKIRLGEDINERNFK